MNSLASRILLPAIICIAGNLVVAQDTLPRPMTTDAEAVRRLQVIVEEARAIAEREQATLAQLRQILAPDNPLLAAQQQRAAVALKAADEAAARMATEQRRVLAAQPMGDLIARLEAERDRAVAAELEKRVLLDRIRVLELRLAELEKPMGKEPNPPDRNPPAEKIDGQVTQAAENLIKINLGTDAGLKAGHTLELFRLGQRPAYLGTVRITAVDSKSAVAQPVGKLNGVPQVGDNVSSRLQ